MSRSYVDTILPRILTVFSEPGVEYADTPTWDDEGNPIYPPDGSVQLVFGMEHGNTAINLTPDQAEELWGSLGNTIQKVKHERIVP